jgi:dihydrofolate reductase
MSLSIIAAVASNGVIGGDNRLLWHLSDDLKRFKRLTMGRPIIMGRKTFESLPKLLPGREHFVLSRDPHYQVPEGVHLFTDVKELLRALPEGENFIIGGAHIYQLLLPYADVMYLTELAVPYEGDAYFPSFEREDWDIKETVEGDNTSIPHRFVTYTRKLNKKK